MSSFKVKSKVHKFLAAIASGMIIDKEYKQSNKCLFYMSPECFLRD